jgi:hypothetical protein
MICTPRQILFGRSNQEERNRWGMLHVLGMGGGLQGFDEET